MRFSDDTDYPRPQAYQPSGRFAFSPIKISSDMTPPELAVALRKLAAKAATADGLRLLELAATFERPARAPRTEPRAARRRVDFYVNGKGYRQRGRKERLGSFSLAGL